jgi:2-polyprenyl-6-methoxyphenol hydroxylase-like FAD-dependent oxidoreductase
VGGSLAGLFHAIVFKHLGHNVHILEQSSQFVLQSQAASLRAGPTVQNTVDKYLKSEKAYAKTSNIVEVLNLKGAVINSFPSDDTMYLTTWSLLYGLLKSHFSGEGSTSSVLYETNKRVGNIVYTGDKVAITYYDANTGLSNVLQADMVNAADGVHSRARESVEPGLSPKYAGYVTWRGAVPEKYLKQRERLYRIEFCSFEPIRDTACRKHTVGFTRIR